MATSSGTRSEEVSGPGADPTLRKSQDRVLGRTIASKQVSPALVSLGSGARNTLRVSQENSSSSDEETKQTVEVTHPRSYRKLISKSGVKSVLKFPFQCSFCYSMLTPCVGWSVRGRGISSLKSKSHVVLSIIIWLIV